MSASSNPELLEFAKFMIRVESAIRETLDQNGFTIDKRMMDETPHYKWNIFCHWGEILPPTQKTRRFSKFMTVHTKHNFAEDRQWIMYRIATFSFVPNAKVYHPIYMGRVADEYLMDTSEQKDLAIRALVNLINWNCESMILRVSYE